MDYAYIADFITHTEYLIKINMKKHHELVKKGSWSIEDEVLANELKYEYEELVNDLEEARDALSQCD
jgi:hypothetical protein